MADSVYLQVREDLRCPVETEIVLFVTRFNQIVASGSECTEGPHDCLLTNLIQIYLVKFKDSPYLGSLPRHVLSGIGVKILEEKEIPLSVQWCLLPSAISHGNQLVHSGLCGVLRQIVKLIHQKTKCQKALELLGFKQGCLKACSEVSQWTKFCEVEVPKSVTKAVSDNGAILPGAFQKLEEHLGKPPPVANREKKIRELRRKRLTKTASNLTKGNFEIEVIKTSSKDNSISVQKCAHDLSHCSLLSNSRDPGGDKYSVGGAVSQHAENSTTDDCGTEEINDTAEILERSFTEGPDMTLTDLVLFTSISWYLKHTGNTLSSLDSCCPLVAKWFRRMQVVPGIMDTAEYLGLSIEISQGGEIRLEKPLVQNKEQNNLEQHVREASKKPKVKTEDVKAVIQKLQEAGLEATMSDHPCGSDVHLDWDSLPAGVHPKQGELPKSRIERKCQQLENLASAVVKIAKPGDVIVDFCSGGGHLGIAIAYLLPECKVILVENKEESIARGLKRVQDLGLQNITIYQSNLDYFQGSFNIGVCLHACGVATDLVLQKCLDVNADFVICPCCYGAIKNTHTMSYPRSEDFRSLDISYEEYTQLCHAADQTQTNTPLAAQGKQCMAWIDGDRGSLAKSCGYRVTLCSLLPLACTPKNNLLVGTCR
ncbi:glutathione S-transferase C-terminal domain-containing protein [Lingula anatina]|uniref:Glutathione S-transferase C-terminal domain-containing protein n=1 Tax=Lingula anatina TaxID=7574 RepID=A0A1S3HMI1_LINAN|nr:glutathione S-transferase C-terminal domain-containing protein [Lingula anatina]XP_013387275.1 glutathione S-transferase C-terminal domain-containing protein [Lingula anatina]XP_013387276.1 glutathione S-transferase C-terminal domain-containing protein [Lingula anatina]XP_013387277.1 glutathione S-transferase C-terminal domain-containing protein [Lingula anatina]XP_013387278.1 glutathione S-transferase C-terminal domain-containing protein [Lingula anatina]XP_013387279.1 glutathione S-transf|eukprot:XP_013387274.1 glutathione S-transferase C-terminal domain-containing protein [Lingula anatina]